MSNKRPNIIQTLFFLFFLKFLFCWCWWERRSRCVATINHLTAKRANGRAFPALWWSPVASQYGSRGSDPEITFCGCCAWLLYKSGRHNSRGVSGLGRTGPNRAGYTVPDFQFVYLFIGSQESTHDHPAISASRFYWTWHICKKFKLMPLYALCGVSCFPLLIMEEFSMGLWHNSPGRQ